MNQEVSWGLSSTAFASPSAVSRQPEWVLPIQSPILICLLGQFRLTRGGIPLFKNCPKVELLLSTLALRPKYAMPRECLLELLWPETLPHVASPQLRNLMFKLRRALGTALNGQALVIRDSNLYRLNMDTGIEIDVHEFALRVTLGDQALHRQDGVAAARYYRNAIDLYQGDLLQHNIGENDNSYEIMIERERLQAMYVRALNHLANYSLTSHAYLDSLNFAHAILQNNPCYEPAYRLIMTCHVRRNERALAFNQYEICLKTLQRVCAVEPERETRELFERIRLRPESI